MKNVKASILSALVGAAVVSPFIGAVATTDTAAAANAATAAPAAATATPIKHLVVIFNENISFDHYFGTYPHATNPAGEPQFHAALGTPAVNGLNRGLLTRNPNGVNSQVNGAGATNPFRLDRSEAATADQDHDYTPEQLAFDHGLMDAFPASVGTAGPPPTGTPLLAPTGLSMGYYDGNTVTAMWNYAQRYAMSDNSYDTTFGPSTVGAANLISGQTNGAGPINSMTLAADGTYDEYTANGTTAAALVPDGNGGLT